MKSSYFSHDAPPAKKTGGASCEKYEDFMFVDNFDDFWWCWLVFNDFWWFYMVVYDFYLFLMIFNDFNDFLWFLMTWEICATSNVKWPFFLEISSATRYIRGRLARLAMWNDNFCYFFFFMFFIVDDVWWFLMISQWHSMLFDEF